MRVRFLAGSVELRSKQWAESERACFIDGRNY